MIFICLSLFCSPFPTYFVLSVQLETPWMVNWITGCGLATLNIKSKHCNNNFLVGLKLRLTCSKHCLLFAKVAEWCLIISKTHRTVNNAWVFVSNLGVDFQAGWKTELSFCCSLTPRINFSSVCSKSNSHMIHLWFALQNKCHCQSAQH